MVIEVLGFSHEDAPMMTDEKLERLSFFIL